ncbi:unnamed protein product [Fusarium fujikuroi]|nr:uncharacterized protein FFE2_04743 [Fusarium fujikuroi]SCV35014.1 uncharacterized protein FFFS_04551 [Fusarium fujikuroi]VZH99859.1 unnamed protein product [Fusarium fujikuroi]
MTYDERWLMEAPPLSPESSAPGQDDSISSSTSIFNFSQYRDYQGKEISVHVIGEQTNALWQPQKCQALNGNQAEDYVDGLRKPEAPIVVFPVLPRAFYCNELSVKRCIKERGGRELIKAIGRQLWEWERLCGRSGKICH